MLPEKVRSILEEAREKILELENERDELQEHLSEAQQVRNYIVNFTVQLPYFLLIRGMILCIIFRKMYFGIVL